MKYYFKHLFKTPMLLVFFAMLIFFGAASIGENAEINRYVVVTALGIDKTEGDMEYEVSFLSFLPVAQQSFEERYKVITAKGDSVAQALDFAGLQVGREVGLSHLKLIVLNQELLSEDVSSYIDYLARNKHVSSSTKLITTNTSAKEFLEAAQKLDSESSVKVSDIISFNLKHIYAADSSLEIFFKGSYGPTRVGIMSVLDVVQSQNGGATETMASGDSGEGGSGGSASSTPQKEIVNKGETAIFKDNKLKLTLPVDAMTSINFMQGECSICSLKIEDFTDETFKNCDLTFEIFDKKIDYKVVFENNVPVVNINNKLSLKLSEVEGGNGGRQENIEFFVISNKAKQAIQTKVKQMMADGLEVMRENQVDIIDVYTKIHNQHPKAFKKFLNSLEDKEDYLNRIVFKACVDIQAK